MSEIIKQDIGEKLADSFMSYAMYVITDRALPDIKDGLKPVQRRILYSMNDLGLNYNKSFKKSARLVGDVLGRFHPHGDTSIYGAMVNMAQDFNMRYPLVNGHGNYGSQDGDSPAAMRYTETKLSLFGETMLRDINKSTVNFKPNFDESLEEPAVLPSLFPNLLANGTTGIAVSMATSIPPHHAGSLYDAVKAIIRNELEGEKTSIEELIDIVQAPDFPTGAQLVSLKDVHKAYRTGRGRALLRSKYEIEEVKDRKQIVVSEIPYKVNKARLVEQIDKLRRDSMNEVREVRDESDKEGIRIVIELKKGVNADFVIKKLLKRTQLQDSFSMNMVALINDKPHQFNLKEALEYFLAHVGEVIIRRTNYDLARAEKRKHIVEGIIACLENIDEVIESIKASKTNAEIIENLQSNFGLSEDQAKSISEMRLKALSQASKSDYADELDKIINDIASWNDIINDKTALLNTIYHEIDQVSEIFKDDRRTKIVSVESISIDDRELVKSEDLIVTLTANGIIKSVKSSEMTTKNRATKGSKESSVKDNDSIDFLVMSNSRDDLLFFTNTGRCHVVPAYKLPILSKTQAGKYVNNYVDLEDGEKIVSVLAKSMNTTDSGLLFLTRGGVGKRLELSELSSVRSTTKVISFRDQDELVSVILLGEGEEVLALTANGQCVRFNPFAEGTKGIRPMGRAARGVNVVKLTNDDYVIGGTPIIEGEDLFLTTENGLGKRIAFSEFNVLTRGAKGVRSITINERTGKLVSAISVSNEDDLIVATANRIINRISIDDVRSMGRAASGVKLINLNEDDYVVSVSKDREIETEDGDSDVQQ